MIITEFMENGSLDTFLKVSHATAARLVSMLTGVIAECVITPYIITPVVCPVAPIISNDVCAFKISA